jgi:pimeloyl-ACP methyl ester carboxylesterase
MAIDDLLSFSNIETNGIRLHVAKAGAPDQIPVILLHGFPEFWYGWRSQILPLAEAGFQVIVPDQRGYNLSEKPDGIASYHIDKLAKDVIGLMDSTGKEKINLVGHDWGAAVAWHVAGQYPERLDNLAILNVPHPDVMVSTLRSSLSQLMKSWYILFFQLPSIPERVMSWNGYQTMRWMMHASSRPNAFEAADLDRYVNAWSQPRALTAMLNWYRAAFRWGQHKIVSPARIRVPTLMLWGRNDMALSSEMAQQSIELCDLGQLVLFENTSHWIQHEQTDEVNRLLIEFLRDHF